MRGEGSDPTADLAGAAGDRDGEPTEPLGWLSEVGIASASDPVRVRLLERVGSQVLLRQVDPADPEPERVPIYEGDELVVVTALSHVSVHTSPEPGSSEGFLFSYRIVPVREEPGRVIARTLRFGESDSGARVHVRPGDQLVLEDMVVELDHLDHQESMAAAGAGTGGEVGVGPLTPVLSTWLSLGPGHDENRTRYVLAAARRLDRATQLLSNVERGRRRLLDGTLDDQGGPAIRRAVTELFGTVEVGLVALGRAVDMVTKAEGKIGCRVPVPAQVIACGPAVKAIRDSLEHVEDRAVGEVHHKPHPDAVSIFDQRRLVPEGVVVYGGHTLDLTSQVPALLAEVRQFLKDAVADG